MGKPEAPLDPAETSGREEPSSKKRNRRTKAELGLRNLPVIEKETLTPEEVLKDPEGFKKIGERHHDELDIQPSRLQWLRTIIPEYAPVGNSETSPLRSAAPEASIPGAMITPTLAAQLIIDKYCDHLPQYRQMQRFFREQNVEISHKTLNSWTLAAARHLAPIAANIGKELQASKLLQIDETPMHYLIPGTGKAHTGYIWVMRDPQTKATYYHWAEGRKTKELLKLLGHDEKSGVLAFSGTIQCDGYICYETLKNNHTGIQLGACMAHIRRKFLDDTSLQIIPWVAYLLRSIRVLYLIERRLRNTHAPPDQVERTRQRYAKPIIAKIENLLKENLNQQRPSSSCGKAINHALGQWDQLKRYLETGTLPIYNNGVENAIRPCKLGLKNYLFFGSFEAGAHNTVLYTLIESCKAAGLNLRAYLEHVIKELKHQPARDLTPTKVAKLWETQAKSEAA